MTHYPGFLALLCKRLNGTLVCYVLSLKASETGLVSVVQAAIERVRVACMSWYSGIRCLVGIVSRLTTSVSIFYSLMYFIMLFVVINAMHSK